MSNIWSWRIRGQWKSVVSSLSGPRNCVCETQMHSKTNGHLTIYLKMEIFHLLPTNTNITYKKLASPVQQCVRKVVTWVIFECPGHGSLSAAVINTKPAWEERVYLVHMSWPQPRRKGHRGRNAGQEPGGKHWSRGHGGGRLLADGSCCTHPDLL